MLKYTFGILLFILTLSSCTSVSNISSSSGGIVKEKNETLYEVFLPLLLDAKKVSYNQTPQKGQTWIGMNSISWVPEDGIQSSIQKDSSISYFCVSPKKATGSLMDSMYTEKYPLSDTPEDFIKIPLTPGSLDQEAVNIAFVSQNINPDRSFIFHCAIDSSGIVTLKEKINKGISRISYRIQYPVGTKIVIGTGSNSKEYTIASNYASAGNMSTGVLSISDYLDICFVDNTCKTKSINIRLLSGEVINITNSIEQQRKNRGGSENFLIPADTAELEFLFYKDTDTVSGEFIF